MLCRMLWVVVLGFLICNRALLCSDTTRNSNEETVLALSSSPAFLLLNGGAEEELMALFGLELKGIYGASKRTKAHSEWEGYVGGGLYVDVKNLRRTALQVRTGARKNTGLKNGYYLFWGPSAFVLFPSGQKVVKAVGLEAGVYYLRSHEVALSVYAAEQQKRVNVAFQIQVGFTFPLF